MTERTRAVSTTLGYTLTLAISTLLVTGLIIAGGNFVSDQRELVIENELEVVGEQIAGQLEQADRLVTASDTVTSVRINRSIPERASGSTYNVLLEPGSTDQLLLETRNPDVSVVVELNVTNDLEESSAGGGAVMVRWCSSCGGGALVIDDA